MRNVTLNYAQQNDQSVRANKQRTDKQAILQGGEVQGL